ncbi:phage tail protein [Phyllobacterium phragmitis]|uniref:Phage tail protein n=1 Tax=Phyllobacterium phragmitis TaxID=2670329 RepID=A0ABQ0GYH4_9HYPH
MSYPAFILPEGVGVDTGGTITVKPRVRRAGLGEGYVQRAGDGLNAMPRNVEVSFSLLVPEEAQTIEAFFTERKGYLPFTWTLPHETAPRQWIAPEWRKITTAPHVLTVSVKLEENFDP